MMGTTAIWVYAIGFLAQGFFSARMLLQWGMSEKAHRVVSPNIYWICSLVGSILLFAYGWLRNDFAIILGQMISYYIYIWNLNIKGVWQRVPRGLRLAIGALPAVSVVMMASDGAAFVASFLHNEECRFPCSYGDRPDRWCSRCASSTNGTTAIAGMSRCCRSASGSSV